MPLFAAYCKWRWGKRHRIKETEKQQQLLWNRSNRIRREYQGKHTQRNSERVERKTVETTTSNNNSTERHTHTQKEWPQKEKEETKKKKRKKLVGQLFVSPDRNPQHTHTRVQVKLVLKLKVKLTKKKNTNKNKNKIQKKSPS